MTSVALMSDAKGSRVRHNEITGLLIDAAGIGAIRQPWVGHRRVNSTKAGERGNVGHRASLRRRCVSVSASSS